MKRRLIVDAQVFQTPAWHRGMGKYSLDLLAALVPLALNSGWSTVELLLAADQEEDTDMRPQLAEKLKDAKIVDLPLMPNKIGDREVPHTNRQIVDDYIEKSSDQGDAVDFLILSLMQGEIYPVFPNRANVRKHLIFYDVVPLMFHDMYLDNPITRMEYLSKIDELLKADTYLAISKTVANDLALYLGIDKERVVSIDGGPVQHAVVPKATDAPKPFILMPTGNDLRKNNERAIRGFEEFNKRNGKKYTLLVTSYFKDFQIEELSRLSDSVVFTGNISGEELSYLYQECELLLFPSEYEGLGMPILEALEYKKPVACSNIAVFREMSETAFAYFDPYSAAEIAATLEQVTRTPGIDEKAYANILARYSWDNTAKKLIEATIEWKPATPETAREIAMVGPNPSCNGAAGRFMQMAYGEQSRSTVPTFYFGPATTGRENRINYLPYVAPASEIVPGMDFKLSASQSLYNLDDTADSAEALFVALANPGVGVLHQLPGEGVWQAMVEKGLIHESRLHLEARLAAKVGQKSCLLGSLVALQAAVIVFDAQSKRKVEQAAAAVNSKAKVFQLALPAQPLVYDDVLLEKTVPVRAVVHDFPGNEAITDFRYYEELAKTKVLIVDGESTRYGLEAMRYGTVLCLTAEQARSLGIPDGAFLKIKTGMDTLAAAHALAEDEATFKGMSRKAQDFIRSQNSYRQYADDINNVLKTVSLPAQKEGGNQ